MYLYCCAAFQETFVLYDPAAADAHPDGIFEAPSFPTDELQYFFRHLSPLQQLAREHIAYNGAMNFTHTAGGFGHALPLQPPAFRLPAQHELAETDTDGDGVADDVAFSCTVPVVVYSSWSMNILEFEKTVPAALADMQKELHLMDDRVAIALAVPEKLPLESFNRFLLQPFTQSVPRTCASHCHPISTGAPAEPLWL